MPTIAEIRQQFPDYNDLSDGQLATALHGKFYSDMPISEFNAKIGLKEAPKEPPNSIMENLGAAAGGFVRDIPIIGPALDAGALKAAAGIRSYIHGTPYEAEHQVAIDYAKELADRNPISTAVGGVVGNIAALAPLGMTALGGRALGITGPALAGRVGAGALSGSGIGAADTAVRGGDVGTGAGIGAVAGMAGPLVGSAIGRAISPLRTPPERQVLVNALEREGVPMTAGDRTGNRPLRWMETSLGDLPGSGGAISAAKENQGQAFTAATLQRAGETANLATPDVMQNAATRIGNQFENLSSRNVLQYDQPFAQDIANTVGQYDRVLNSQQREVFHNYVQDIISQPGGRMTGDVYQEARSRLSRQSHNIAQTDPTLSEALGGLRDALDSGMARSISPADAAAWTEARGQWGNMRTIEKAMSGAGERTAEGYISPQQLRAAVANRNRPAYVRGQGDLAELARAGAAVLHPLPNSGTAPRAFMSNIATMLSTGGGGAIGGIPGAIAGAAAPGLLARALLSRPVQGYLANQAAGPGTQSAIARALAGPNRAAALALSEDERRRIGQSGGR